MATVHISEAVRNALAEAVRDKIDAGAAAGTLKIYTGAMPANANTAASGTLLATVTLTDPSAGAATAGVVTLGDPASVNWSASGTAGWCRVADSDGNTVLDGDVTNTAGTGFLRLSTVTAVSGDPVDIQSGGTLTMPDGT
jgi:hypothetical protein